jgi:hypothetical protein
MTGNEGGERRGNGYREIARTFSKMTGSKCACNPLFDSIAMPDQVRVPVRVLCNSKGKTEIGGKITSAVGGKQIIAASKKFGDEG